MPKFKILFGRPTSDGTTRTELDSYHTMIETRVQCDPDIKDLVEETYHVPVQKFPTSCSRNSLVKAAFENACDLLFMVDADAAPNFDWFKTAFLFLINHPGPAVIGAPYCSGGGEIEEVQVFEFKRKISNVPLLAWQLEHYGREEAAYKTGIQRVMNIGTHQIAYRLDAFRKVKQPYYAYQYNADHTAVTETEDCWCHRRMFEAGVPIYCDWDHWAGHYKTSCIGRPIPLHDDAIPEFYQQKARAWALEELRRAAEPKPEPTPEQVRASITDEELAELKRLREAKAKATSKPPAAEPANGHAPSWFVFDTVSGQAVPVPVGDGYLSSLMTDESLLPETRERLRQLRDTLPQPTDDACSSIDRFESLAAAERAKKAEGVG